MKAIINRLRNYAKNPSYSHNDYTDTMREAADAITQLQQQVADLTAERDAIAKAALEAANECERMMMMYPGGRQESFAHHGVQKAASAIRAIDPATIVAKVEGKS